MFDIATEANFPGPRDIHSRGFAGSRRLDSYTAPPVRGFITFHFYRWMTRILALRQGIDLRANVVGGLWTTAAVLSSVIGIHLDTVGQSHGSSSVLYLLALIMGSHGRNLSVTALWTFACSLGIVASGGTNLDYFTWPATEKLVALAGMAGVAFVVWCQQRSRNKLIRRLDAASSERQELADALPHVVWGTSTVGRCDFLNDRYTETFGIPRSKAIRDQSWTDPIHPADLTKMQGAWRIAIDSGSAFYSAHARMRMNNGSYRWMESIGRSVRSSTTGETLRWFGSLLDVQNQVEDREMIARLQFDLQEISDECENRFAGADERLRAIFETRVIGWIEYDVKSVNRLAGSLRSLGVVNIREHLDRHPADAEELQSNIRMLDASQHAWSALGFQSFTDMVSKRELARDIHAIDVEATILKALVAEATTVCGLAHLSDAGGTARIFPFTVWISEDGIAKVAFLDTLISDDRVKAAGNARRELARVNRIAASSALSASLIHQISQPITAISLDVATATRLIAAEEGRFASVAKVMERVRWNTQRLSDIGTSTRHILKSGQQIREPVDIVELIRRTYNLLLDPLDPNRRNLSIVADEHLPLISVDRVALQQVIFALLQNSLDNQITVGEPPQISVTIRYARSIELNLVFEDSGPGIQSEHSALLFDPFFSTKPNHLGFGLTISQSIVEGFGGSLTVGNRLGGGARAELSVPINAQRPPRS